MGENRGGEKWGEKKIDREAGWSPAYYNDRAVSSLIPGAGGGDGGGGGGDGGGGDGTGGGGDGGCTAHKLMGYETPRSSDKSPVAMATALKSSNASGLPRTNRPNVQAMGSRRAGLLAVMSS